MMTRKLSTATGGLHKVGSTGDVSGSGIDDTKKLSVWCSVLQRTIRTAAEVKKRNEDKVYGKVVEWRGLTEIDAGVYDGLTYEEIEQRDPVGYAARNTDKLRYRYPQGESYVDVIERLEAVIFELERAKGPVLVVGHQAVLRCLYGYFLDIPLDEIPFLDVPLHTVIKLTPKAYRCVEERFTLMRSTHSHPSTPLGVTLPPTVGGLRTLSGLPSRGHVTQGTSPVDTNDEPVHGPVPPPTSSSSSSLSSTTSSPSTST